MTVSLNNVPYLTDDKIEQASWDLLWDYAQKESWEIAAPIPIETIAENLMIDQLEITADPLF